MTVKIATIITVFNRKQKTLSSLQHLFEAEACFNNTAEGNTISLSVFITDDGCTDGTANAVKTEYPDHDITILQGTGNLYWAGGMRMAWQAAIDTGTAWDYFLLLNDDTNMNENAFKELFDADDYAFQHEGKHGITSGITCDPQDSSIITYGGNIFIHRIKGKQTMLQPAGVPQKADVTHANILLIHQSVVSSLGIFYKGFIHGGADFDYSMQARRHGFPVWITAQICGECDFDHKTDKEEILKLADMSLSERRRYVNHPTHSDHDYLLQMKRNMPIRYPFCILIRQIRLYFPSLYKWVSEVRGLY